MAGFNVPAAEVSIAASVIALGAVVALVGFFAIFHGYAHGTEIPSGATALSFGYPSVISKPIGYSVSPSPLQALYEPLGRRMI